MYGSNGFFWPDWMEIHSQSADTAGIPHSAVCLNLA
jgi:hypothetical protein